MARKTLGSFMEERTPADSPSQPLEEEKRSTYYSFKDLSPDRVKYILQRADAHGELGYLYKLYDDMEVSDTRYSGILGQLRNTIAGMPLRVMPAEGRTESEQEQADEYADYAKEMMTTLDTQALTREFIEPYFRGAALFSVDWQMKDLPFNRQMWFPDSIERVDGKHFEQEVDSSLDTFGELKVEVEDTGIYQPISQLPFDNHLFLEIGKGKGRYARMGVARKVMPWWISLRFVQTWWVQFIESYGEPMRVGKYPRGASRQKRMKMKNFLKEVGRHGYGLFPHGMEVELKEMSQKGQITTYQDFINKGHQEYSIHILGQAGTTGEGSGGSFAETSELNGIRMDIVKNVAAIGTKGYTNLAKKGLRLNYGSAYEEHLAPTIRPMILNSANAQKLAKAARIVSTEMGVPVPENYVYEEILGVERPQEGESAVVAGEQVVLGDDPIPSANASQNGAQETQRQADDTGDTSIANGGRETSNEADSE